MGKRERARKMGVAIEKETCERLDARWAWIGLLLLLLVVTGIRWRLLDVPLERDEGEYAYAGQLMLQGIPPFAEAYNMKMPGIYAAYAVVMAAFGETIRGVHLGLWAVNLAGISFVFLLGRKLLSAAAGLWAAMAYAAMSLSLSVLGLYAHATHFVVLFMLPGLLLLLYAIEKERWGLFAASGVMLGVAFLMKQHAAPVILFAGLYLVGEYALRRPVPIKALAIACVAFSVGALAPYLLTCASLWKAGVFKTFWFWTIDYARAYVSMVTLSDGFQLCKGTMSPMVASGTLFWVCAVLGLAAMLADKGPIRRRVFLAALFVASFLAVCPGLFFRQHYFVVFLPAAALAGGYAAERLRCALEKPLGKRNAAVAAVFLGAIGCGQVLFCERVNLFERAPTEVTRAVYGINPFPESVEIAQYIEAHSSPADTVAVLGSEPQICFYCHRKSATGYIYMYPLMEYQPYALEMQENAIREIESARPKFLVFTHIRTSWLIRPRSERRILDWAPGYFQKNYALAGAIDMASSPSPEVAWGDAARSVPLAEQGAWVAVYERKGAESP